MTILTKKPTNKDKVVSRLLNEPLYRKVYHIFADNIDEWTTNYKEAIRKFNSMCKCYSNVRLYTSYETEDGYGDIVDGDCLKAKGDFPT